MIMVIKMRKKSKKTKKGEFLFSPLVWGIIALVVVVVIIISWSVMFGKSRKNIDDYQDGTADPDRDGVINLFDKCPETGLSEFKGCPSQEALDNAEEKTKDANK